MKNNKVGSLDEEAEAATVDFAEEAPKSDESCLDVIRNEFQWKNFGLNFSRRDAFETSQWPWPRAVFIVYRSALAVYTVAIVCHTAVNSSTFTFQYLTWCTYWAFLFLTAHCAYSAVIACVSCAYRPSAQTPDGKLPVYLKIDWFLFIVASTAAPIVTVTYFGYLYSFTQKKFHEETSINEHLFNTVVIILEYCIAAIPVRFLHFVYPVAVGVVYAIFSAIYWAVDHNNVLYPIVCDWNKPGLSIGALLGYYILVIPIVQLLLFTAYRARLSIYRCIYRTPYVQ